MFKDWLENSLLANVETSTKQVIHVFWSWLTQKQLSRVWLLNHLKWPVTDSWGQCRQGDSSTSHTDEWSHTNHDAHKQQGCWCVAPNQESALQEPADQMEDQTAEFPGVFRCFWVQDFISVYGLSSQQPCLHRRFSYHCSCWVFWYSSVSWTLTFIMKGSAQKSWRRRSTLLKVWATHPSLTSPATSWRRWPRKCVSCMLKTHSTQHELGIKDNTYVPTYIHKYVIRFHCTTLTELCALCFQICRTVWRCLPVRRIWRMPACTSHQALLELCLLTALPCPTGCDSPTTGCLSPVIT